MPRKIRGIDYRCLVGTYGTKHCAPFCGEVVFAAGDGIVQVRRMLGGEKHI